MTSVWESAPYTEGTLLVLLALADWASDDGICWPKIKTLADKARLSERGAQNSIKRLIADGSLSVAQESSCPGEPRKYQIGVQFLHPSKRKGVQLEAEMGAVGDEKGCSSRHRNKEEPSLEPSLPTTRIDGLFPLTDERPKDDVIERLWNYYLKTMDRSLATLTPKRRKMGELRFKEALKLKSGDRKRAEVVMEIAIEQLASSPWHQGKNPSGKKYLSWEHAFRSPEQFEMWIARSNGE